MSKSDYVVVAESRVVHEGDSLAGAAAISDHVCGSAVYERVEVEDADARFDRMVERIKRERKGGAS